MRAKALQSSHICTELIPKIRTLCVIKGTCFFLVYTHSCSGDYDSEEEDRIFGKFVFETSKYNIIIIIITATNNNDNNSNYY